MNGETNNLFQNQTNQYQYGDMNQYYNGGFMTRQPIQRPNNIPVRVVFSPEQIAPQEIPTNGTPALFPLSDGSKIIARSLTGNGLFEERTYVLQPLNVIEDDKNESNKFEQVMERLGVIENSLNQVLGDLYGSKPENQNQEVKSDE